MWQWYAIVAMACFAAMQLLFKHLTRTGMTSPAILVVVFSLASVLYLLHVGTLRTPLGLNSTNLVLLSLAAVLSYVGNLCSVRAMAEAPNPGYATAIVGVHALVITLVAAGVFGVELSPIKGLGVLLCVLGIALLVI
jgi:drug/metabolite transporter (DMT)-like permease